MRLLFGIGLVLVFLISQGQRLEAKSTWPPPPTVKTIALGDITGDGKAEVARERHVTGGSAGDCFSLKIISGKRVLFADNQLGGDEVEARAYFVQGTPKGMVVCFHRDGSIVTSNMEG